MSSEHEPLESDTASASDDGFEPLLEYLGRTRGFDFMAYKRPTLMRRVQRRMETVGVRDFHHYIDHLDQHPDEFHLKF